MAAGVVQLGAVNGAHLKHAAKKRHAHLLILLRALRQRGVGAKIF
ncbi:hypothetical protein SDC9_118232 [bioreactor metagenome]|uniref:Uncharacterized protein n=1 Tax=bioreactor metagenome TaxID=1076179 RepID=A0A645C1Q1_9ZZZZ